MKKLVVFASGSGTNALNLIHHFKKGETARVVAVFCNNPNAGVIDKAKKENVPVIVFSKQDFQENNFDSTLSDCNPDLIVLAGFLLLFPQSLVAKYTNKIVNIHPAVLPKYGGRGMYGDHVHNAVLANGEKEHGVTVHLVNEEYDKGEIISQEAFKIEKNDTLESVAKKIHALEFEIYPKAIEKILRK